jgi:hypothetical protein
MFTKNIHTLFISPPFNRFKIRWNGSFNHRLQSVSLKLLQWTVSLVQSKSVSRSNLPCHLAEHSRNNCQGRQPCMPCELTEYKHVERKRAVQCCGWWPDKWAHDNCAQIKPHSHKCSGKIPTPINSHTDIFDIPEKYSHLVLHDSGVDDPDRILV